MNHTLVVTLAALGILLWLIAAVRERFQTASGGAVWKFMQNFFSVKAAGTVSASIDGTLTIDALERELGIEPDHYLCDRISRINAALVARRDKQASTMKGGAQ